jgi:triphosphoribosyl-dephospho-CoA synthetase
LAEGVSIEMVNIVFDMVAQKMIKDVFKCTHLVSTALYYSQVLKYLLKHLLYLMANYYLITTFVVLLIGAEAADKAQPDARHLLDQGAAASRKGRLTHQRSGGLRRDVRVVSVRRV